LGAGVDAAFLGDFVTAIGNRYLNVIYRVVLAAESFSDPPLLKPIELFPVEVRRRVRSQRIEPLDDNGIDEPIELAAHGASSGQM